MRHLGQIGAIVVDMRGENVAFAFFWVPEFISEVLHGIWYVALS